MSHDGPSNLRVFVRWHDQTVFAGEEVKCTITFKNVAAAQSPGGPQQLKASPQQSRAQNAERARQVSPLHAPHRSKPSSGLAPPSSARGHRSSLSLSGPSRSRTGSISWAPPPLPSSAESHAKNGHSHRRSVSIVSIGSVNSVDSAPPAHASSSKRPARGHARASSLQIMPRNGVFNGPRSASYPQRPFNPQNSPLFNASYPPDRNLARGRIPGSSTVPNTPGLASITSPRLNRDPLSDFKFPMIQSPLSEARGIPPDQGDDRVLTPTSAVGEPISLPVRPRDPIPIIHEQTAAPAARVLSTTSIAGTPRSSGEFYSMSNNSSETLASEYVAHQPLRGQGRPPHIRQRSNLLPQKARVPESLMMGYAQIQGSFTLDGSLISLGPFEQVKRKAVVGGQGGGVVGIDTSRRDGGLLRGFGGFGWGSITNSLGELLGGGELSSIKDMRGIASSKAVPLLSTPQSILFVDLQLGPGESRSFEYSFRLPRGLPPTHRGKTMKISYSLVIGTQRPGGAKEQQVRSVEMPFRVLGSVNSHGEILGHDLMSPYVLLRDQAKVQAIDRSASPSESIPKTDQSVQPAATLNGFLSYVDELLNRPRQGSGGGLLSPSAVPSSRRPSAFEDATTAKDAIDLAILRSNLASDGQQSANRFEIARNGRRVGVVMLVRPAYRLGEVVTMAIDFTGAEVPCYAVHAALETAERIDPSLALRSEASIHRASRKVHVSSSEATLFARRIVFAPTIPVSATPEFVTSGVSLEWKIRLEFVVPAQNDRTPEGEADEGQEAGGPDRRTIDLRQTQGPHPLLEEISRDERGGLVLVAAENLACESFEVAVPLRVYGAVCTGLERLERDEAQEEGLVV